MDQSVLSAVGTGTNAVLEVARLTELMCILDASVLLIGGGEGYPIMKSYGIKSVNGDCKMPKYPLPNHQ